MGVVVMEPPLKKDEFCCIDISHNERQGEGAIPVCATSSRGEDHYWGALPLMRQSKAADPTRVSLLGGSV